MVFSFLAADIALHTLNHPALKSLFVSMGKPLPKGGQYRVQKYRGTFLVPLPVPTVLFHKWYRSTGTRYFFKKVFGYLSFLLLLID